MTNWSSMSKTLSIISTSTLFYSSFSFSLGAAMASFSNNSFDYAPSELNGVGQNYQMNHEQSTSSLGSYSIQVGNSDKIAARIPTANFQRFTDTEVDNLPSLPPQPSLPINPLDRFSLPSGSNRAIEAKVRSLRSEADSMKPDMERFDQIEAMLSLLDPLSPNENHSGELNGVSLEDRNAIIQAMDSTTDQLAIGPPGQDYQRDSQSDPSHRSVPGMSEARPSQISIQHDLVSRGGDRAVIEGASPQ